MNRFALRVVFENRRLKAAPPSRSDVLKWHTSDSQKISARARFENVVTRFASL